MMIQDIFALISIFCDVDDFCKQFEPEWNKVVIEDLNSDKKKRNRKTELSLSEAITIVIMFHKTRYRTFKDYYHRFVMHLFCRLNYFDCMSRKTHQLPSGIQAYGKTGENFYRVVLWF